MKVRRPFQFHSADWGLLGRSRCCTWRMFRGACQFYINVSMIHGPWNEFSKCVRTFYSATLRTFEWALYFFDKPALQLQLQSVNAVRSNVNHFPFYYEARFTLRCKKSIHAWEYRSDVFSIETRGLLSSAIDPCLCMKLIAILLSLIWTWVFIRKGTYSTVLNAWVIQYKFE